MLATTIQLRRFTQISSRELALSASLAAADSTRAPSPCIASTDSGSYLGPSLATNRHHRRSYRKFFRHYTNSMPLTIKKVSPFPSTSPQRHNPSGLAHSNSPLRSLVNSGINDLVTLACTNFKNSPSARQVCRTQKTSPPTPFVRATFVNKPNQHIDRQVLPEILPKTLQDLRFIWISALCGHPPKTTNRHGHDEKTNLQIALLPHMMDIMRSF